jgi:hypothetical protein
MRLGKVIIGIVAAAALVGVVRSQITFTSDVAGRQQVAANPRPPAAAPAPPASPRPDDVCNQGRAFAEELLSPHLRAPASAKYPLSTVKGAPLPKIAGLPPLYIVTGSVDSQNGFGAMIRETWSLYLSWNGGRLEPFRVDLGRERFTVRADFEKRVNAALEARGDK